MSNDFHHTKTWVYPKRGVLSPRQLEAAKNRLCTDFHCFCGCIRGPQPITGYCLAYDENVQGHEFLRFIKCPTAESTKKKD